jgi:ATP-dependent Clp protease protease subunit
MIPTSQILKAISAQEAPSSPRLPSIVNTAGNDATIYLYDTVSAWTPAAATEFQKQLSAIKSPVINLRINSPGGSVFEGLAIYQLLKAHPAKVIAHVDGLAASIASIIMLAGDEIHIGDGSMVMVHDASIATSGNAKQLRQDADLVAKISESLTDIYVSRTGKPRAAIRAAMEAETWYNADEAIKAGLATRKVAAVKTAAQWKAIDHPGLPAAALAAAGLTAPESRRYINSELDRLRSENAELRSHIATTPKLMSTQPKTPTATTAAEYGSKPLTMLRSEFEKLTASDRMRFCKAGGKLV